MATIPKDATRRISPPFPDVPVPKVGVDPTKPYVAGRREGFLAGYYASLPHSIDDVTRDFGDDLYERVLNDAQASSCVQLLRLAACDGYAVRPAVTDKKKPGYKEAVRIAEWWEKVLDNVKPSFADFLYQMSSAIAFGNKIAEKSLKVGDDGKWWIECLAVKPRRSTLFVVDTFNRVVGLLSQKPTWLGESIGERYVNDLGSLENFLPREKFAIYTYMPIDGDPRGRSILRPAYAAWLGKVGTLKEQEKYLAQFASPSLIATTAENAISADPTKTPQEEMRDALQAFRNASAIAVPFGSTVTALEVVSGGMSFKNAIDGFDRQIAKAILLQTLATEEGLHQSRASSEVHRGLLEYTVNYIRNGLADMVMNDILYPITCYNEGDELAKLYTPKLVVGDVAETDWQADADAVFKLVSSGYLDPSQYEEMDERLGLPARKVNPMRVMLPMQQPPPQQIPNGQQQGGGQPDQGKPFPGFSETDTYDLPKGRALVPKLRAVFEEQRANVLQRIGQTGTVHFDKWGLPDEFVNLEDWNDAIARDSLPVLELAYTKGIKKLSARIGASPDLFSVVSPNIQQAVARASLKFARSTNETTSMQLNDALTRLRGELVEGLVSGDPLPLLRDRVNAVFDQASQSRAMTIAETESSRALHAGQHLAAKESTVVTRMKWLASSDACQICLGIVAANPDGVPLDGNFVEGEGPYGNVPHPPAHPGCRCSEVAVLSPEYEAAIRGE